MNRLRYEPVLTDHASRFIAAGFTLIEVLVALAITSIVVAALYSTFFLSHRSVDAVHGSLIRLQEARGVLDTLKREIESAFYENGKTYTTFKLDDRDYYGRQASHLSFTAFSPLLPGVSKIAYTVDDSKGRLILKKRIIPAYAPGRETKDVELMEDVGSFTVEVRYNGRWVKTWDSDLSKGIPDEVRVSITLLSGGGQEGGQQGHKDTTRYELTDIARPMIKKTL